MSTKALLSTGAAALALVLVGCGKTEPAATSGPSGTSSGPGSTSAPTATATPGTTGSMGVDTHVTDFADGTKVSGAMTCSVGNKHLRLILKGFADGASVTLDQDIKTGPGTATGEYVLRSKTNGNSLATGPATITTSVYDTKADGREAQGLVFSYSARYAPVRGATGAPAEGTVSGQGSCVVGGDRIGGDKPPTGTSLKMPVTDAKAFAGSMMSIALRGARPKADAFGAVDLWVAESLPRTALAGKAVTATAEKISGFSTVTDKNGSYSAYPFAVSDGTGCAYGVIYTTAVGSEPAGKVLDATGPCTGDGALAAFEATVLTK